MKKTITVLTTFLLASVAMACPPYTEEEEAAIMEDNAIISTTIPILVEESELVAEATEEVIVPEAIVVAEEEEDTMGEWFISKWRELKELYAAEVLRRAEAINAEESVTMEVEPPVAPLETEQ